MSDDTSELFSFPAVGRKKLTATLDGGRITSLALQDFEKTRAEHSMHRD